MTNNANFNIGHETFEIHLQHLLKPLDLRISKKKKKNLRQKKVIQKLNTRYTNFQAFWMAACNFILMLP